MYNRTDVLNMIDYEAEFKLMLDDKKDCKTFVVVEKL